MKVVIAGAGRSGTSVLVKLFAAMGFRTNDSTVWYESARAGLESALRADSPEEVIKDPRLFEYCNDLNDDLRKSIANLIVPIRYRDDAVHSRIILERLHYLENPNDAEPNRWRWKTSTLGVPGGARVPLNTAMISTALAEGMWDLLEWSERGDVPTTLLHYPKFVTDFEYFWNRIGPIVTQRVDEAAARSAWSGVVDIRSKVPVADEVEQFSHLSKPELVALVNQVSQRRREAEQETARLEAELRQANSRDVERVQEISHLASRAADLENSLNRVLRRRSVRAALTFAGLVRRFRALTSNVWNY